MHGFGLEYPGLFAARHPYWSTFLLAVALLASVLSLPFLTFDNKLSRVLLSTSEKSVEYLRFKNELGGEYTDFIVFVEADTPFTANEYRKLRDLALELEFVDGVVGVISPFALRYSQDHPNFPGEPLFKVELDEAEIKSRLEEYRLSERGSRRLISDDERSALIVATAEIPEPDFRSRDILSAIRQLTDMDEGSSLRFTITGERAIQTAIIDELKIELLRLNLLGTLVVILLAFVFLRSLRAVVLAVVPALCGVLVSLSVYTLLGYPITVVNNVIPVLVLVLGVADCVHLTRHLQRVDAPTAEAIFGTIREVGPAVALTAMTTAIAFLAIAISDNEQLFEFAVIGALAVIFAYFTVIVSFVLLARQFRKFEPKVPFSMEPPLSAIAALQRHDRTIMLVSLCMVVIGIIGYARTEPWFRIQQDLPDTSPLADANDRLVETFGGFFLLWAEAELEGGLESPNNWSQVSDLTAAIEAVDQDYAVISLATLARWLGTPEQVPTDDEIANLPASLSGRLLSTDGRMARVVVFVPEPMQDKTTLQKQDLIENAALSAGATRVTGLPVILRYESVAIVRQLGIGLLIACILASFVVAVAFRRPGLLPILIIPNVLPLLVTGTALHVFNDGHLSPPAVLALTIAFGIAIDDSIHFVTRYQVHRHRGLDVESSLRRSIEEIGSVMLLTTILLSAGLLVTLVSPFDPVRLFGSMLILTFIAALPADLLVLPALMRQKWFVR